MFGNANVANPWQLNLIADYNFSKRTDVHLFAAYVKNAGLMFDSALIAYANSLALGNSYTLGNGNSSMVGVSVGVGTTSESCKPPPVRFNATSACRLDRTEFSRRSFSKPWVSLCPK
ncbi:hypothetical protein CBM2633_B60195 [Cupriavidus taiwanensis]|nr:hypothetical protein CBM2633_B60195 [Cupriavidus taiwanensis]